VSCYLFVTTGLVGCFPTSRRTRVVQVEDSGLVDVSEIEAAAGRLTGRIRRTPLVATELGSNQVPLFLKAESLQIGGSFKLRGALNALSQLPAAELARGVITHSSGNHAQAVARAARMVGTTAIVVMPHDTPEVKRHATEANGARVVLVEPSERASAVERLSHETGALFIPPYDHPAVIAGQGTIGLEIIDDLPGLTTVYVPVSGGGLVSGIAAALKARKPGVRIVAVEPELAADLAAGWSSGERVTWPADRTSRTIADGLRVQAVGVLNWRHIEALVDDVVTVSEDEIEHALRRIVLEAKLGCEPSGAVATAGYLADQDPSRRVKRARPPADPALGMAPRPTVGPAVAIVSGGNVDASTLASVLAPGLGRSARRLG
jgi:threonine dehydratase